MQNPFRPHDEPGRPDRDRDRDEFRHEARDRRPEEQPTWGGGDGGRTAEAFRREHQAYGRDPSGPAGAWTQDSYQQGRYGEGYDAHGAQAWGGPRYGQGSGARADARGPQMTRGYADPGYGPSSYGAPRQGGRSESGPYPTHGYAPGAQIWEGSGPGMGGQSHEHHDFEPDYLHWREQQLSAFDKDYSEWRSERRQKFSSDFDSWRQSRPRVQAENPIVGDVSDGGTGDASEVKKR